MNSKHKKVAIAIAAVLIVAASLALVLVKAQSPSPAQPAGDFHANDYTLLANEAGERAGIYEAYRNLYDAIRRGDAAQLGRVSSTLANLKAQEAQSFFPQEVNVWDYSVDELRGLLEDTIFGEIFDYSFETIAGITASTIAGVALNYFTSLYQLYEVTTMLFDAITDLWNRVGTGIVIASCLDEAADWTCLHGSHLQGCMNFWEGNSDTSKIWQLKGMIEGEQDIAEELAANNNDARRVTLERRLLRKWQDQAQVLRWLAPAKDFRVGLYHSASMCVQSGGVDGPFPTLIANVTQVLGEFAALDLQRMEAQISYLNRPNVKIVASETMTDPVYPIIGQDVTAVVNIRNVGYSDAQNAVLNIQSAAQCGSASCFSAQEIIPSIVSQSSQQARLTFSTTPYPAGTHPVIISVQVPIEGSNPQTFYPDLEHDNTFTTTFTFTNIPPWPVTLFSPTQVTNRTLHLQWSEDNEPDFFRYKIYASDALPLGSLNIIGAPTSASTTTCEISSSTCAFLPRPDTRYYFKVVVEDQQYQETASGIVSAVTGVELAAPADSAIESDAVTLSFASDEPTLYSHRVAYTTDPDFARDVRYAAPTAASSFRITNLEQATTYYFKVRTTHNFGAQEFVTSDSNVISVTTGGNPIPEVEMGPEQLVDVGEWVDFNATVEDDDAIVRYEWDFNEDGVFDATTTSPSTRHRYEEPSDLGGYEVKMRATDSEGAIGADTVNVIIRRLRNIHADANDVAVTPLPVRVGQPSSVSMTVRNTGQRPSGVFYVGFHEDNQPEFGNVRMDSIPVDGTALASIAHTFTTVGDHVLRVELDDLNNIPESSELDNTVTRTIAVTGTPRPDLEISSEDIWFTPAQPVLGDYLTVHARVENIGSAPTSDAAAPRRFLNLFWSGPGAPESTTNSIPLARRFIDVSLEPGGNIESEVSGNTSVVPRAGTYNICYSLDVDNVITEANEGNNTACQALTIYADRSQIPPESRSRAGAAPSAPRKTSGLKSMPTGFVAKTRAEQRLTATAFSKFRTREERRIRQERQAVLKKAAP